jgi:hypothetical protein
MIPAEAVEAAADAMAPVVKKLEALILARAALEAAAPYMLKSAYDLGFQHGSNEPANPYRSAK